MGQLSFFEKPQKYNQHVDRDNLIKKLLKLRSLYEAGELGGTTHEVYPPLDRGCVENYLYFTLAPALNFQRVSESLWRSALDTYNDPKTRFVFSPASVGLGVDEYQKALTKHKLALQPNKHTHIWFTLSETLHTYYKDDPRYLIESCDNDVIKILSLLQEKKKLFPYLSGPKLSNYWLYILTYFTDVRLVNKQEISVVPDVHVTRATKYLGLVPNEKQVTPLEIAEVWKTFLQGTELAPSDLHAPLWRWSRKDFKPDL